MPHKKSAAAERLTRERKRKPARAKKGGKAEGRASPGHEKAKKGKAARPAKAAPAPRVAHATDQHADPAKLKGKEKPPRNVVKPGEEDDDALPADIVSSDQIDDVMSMFGDNDIAIVDEANKVKLPDTKPPEPEPVHAKAAEEEAEEKKEQEEEDNYSKSNDPVRMYLRKMGSVSLLTREGEVEIAKRIEDGEKEVLEAVLHSSIAIKEIIQIGDRLRKGKMRVREVIRDAPDEDDETFDEQGRADQVVKLIDKIRRLDRDNEKLREQLDSKTKKLSLSKQKELREEALRNEQQLAETLAEIKLNKRQIER